MQTTIRHICGHTETVQLRGPADERERAVRKLTSRPCRECETARRVRADKAAGLTGSDKQIAWAADIRADVTARIEEVKARSAAAGPETEMVDLALSRLAAITDADWWIDHQSAQQAMQAMLADDEIADFRRRAQSV